MEDLQLVSRIENAAPLSDETASTRSRSKKQLASTQEMGVYQKAWFQRLRQRIAAGEPYVIANADTAHEIFHVMDIPLVTVQWWSAVCAAKQLVNRPVRVVIGVLLRRRGQGRGALQCSPWRRSVSLTARGGRGSRPQL